MTTPTPDPAGIAERRAAMVTIESGHDPRIFSCTYADPLKIIVRDKVVYNSRDARGLEPLPEACLECATIGQANCPEHGCALVEPEPAQKSATKLLVDRLIALERETGYRLLPDLHNAIDEGLASAKRDANHWYGKWLLNETEKLNGRAATADAERRVRKLEQEATKLQREKWKVISEQETEPLRKERDQALAEAARLTTACEKEFASVQALNDETAQLRARVAELEREKAEQFRCVINTESEVTDTLRAQLAESEIAREAMRTALEKAKGYIQSHANGRAWWNYEFSYEALGSKGWLTKALSTPPSETARAVRLEWAEDAFRSGHAKGVQDDRESHIIDEDAAWLNSETRRALLGKEGR